MKPHLMRLQEVFLKAVRASTHVGRAAVLERECSGDDELHSLASKLLRKHDLKNHALDTPAVDLLPTRPSSDAETVDDFDDVMPGTLIAKRYRVIDLLGHGGMGTVYRAEQLAPLQRTVAIKLIRPGLASKSMLARFDSERQALARMDHPSIAKVFDAGTVNEELEALGSEPWAVGGNKKRADAFLSTAHRSLPTIGRPYFVMELVDGIPITQFCTEEKLSLRRRLELFIPICQAIEHAHQKGVIHRDLKPGNILVTKRDGRPVPVVIDFGIAKSVEAQIDVRSHHTGWGLFLGTLDYMAPEQALANSSDIDTRTDVYSLGAVLYELLCGQVPLDRKQLGDVSVFEIASMLKEQYPLPPSARVDRQSKSVAALRGELDWIVIKCLEKDRDRRYPSTRALADDLTRYLANEPVLAGPPTACYRIRKFMKRHVGGVIAACCVMLVLVGGIAGTTYGMLNAWRAEAVAVKAIDEKEKARAAEEQERIRADGKAAQAKFISDFIQFDVLRQANPVSQFHAGFEPDSNLTVKQALDRSAATIESRFGDKPLIVAALFHTIGTSYDGLGEYLTAIKHLQRSYEIQEQHWGSNNDRTISIRHSLARSLAHAKKTDEAIPLFEKNLELLRASVGPDHNKVLNAETDLANAFRDMNRLDEAQQLLTHVYETIRIRAPHSDSLFHTLINLAAIDECRGRFDEAIRKMESLQEHLQRGQELNPRAKFAVNIGLGRFYMDAGRHDEGIHLIESARDIAQSLFGEEHFEHLNAITILSDAYLAVGRPDDAVQLLDRTHKNLQSKLQHYDVRIYRVALELARMAIETGDLKRAESLTQETEAASIRSKNCDSFVRGSALSIRGRCLFLNNRVAEAEPLVREGLGIMTPQLKDDCQTHATRILLGQILLAQGRHAESEVELSAGYQKLKKLSYKLLFATRRCMSTALDAMATCADAQNRPADAARFRAEKLKWIVANSSQN